MIRVVLTDDHEVVRLGLKSGLEQDKNIKVVNQAGTGFELLEILKKTVNFDVIILDLTLPDLHGLEVLKRIKEIRSDIPVIIFSVCSEDNYAIRAFKSGASGYLTKSYNSDEIIKAVKTVITGKRYTNLTTGHLLAEEMFDTQKTGHSCLSDKEFQVMMLLAEGNKSKDIAHNLALSPKTISTHKTNILSKMKVKSTAELTKYVMDNNLLER